MAHEFLHEPDAHRYTLRVDGELVSVLEYRDQGVGVVFHRTVTIPQHRGHGYAADLVDFAVTDVERREAGPISPTCWYVAEWFDKHPDRVAVRA